jgi:hypothetical protein
MKTYLAALLLTLCAGCAQLASIVTPSSAPFIQVAVDVAVATAVQKGVPPAKIKSIAQAVLALDSGSTVVNLAAVQALLDAKLATMNLPPADLAAAQVLTAALDAIIQTKLSAPSAGTVTAATEVAVAQVLNDVISATSAYGV